MPDLSTVGSMSIFTRWGLSGPEVRVTVTCAHLTVVPGPLPMPWHAKGVT